jgi:hypothetical protein
MKTSLWIGTTRLRRQGARHLLPRWVSANLLRYRRIGNTKAPEPLFVAVSVAASRREKVGPRYRKNGWIKYRHFYLSNFRKKSMGKDEEILLIGHRHAIEIWRAGDLYAMQTKCAVADEAWLWSERAG